MSDTIRSIAVVDDDESICTALARLLRASSYQVKTYASGEALLGDPAHRDLNFLVLDVQLQGMSGFELRDRLAAEGMLPPIAFITAHDEPASRERAWKGRCVAYLRKPFPGERLLDAIRTTFASTARPSDDKKDRT
jgi:FixJ family two-component response regulator